MVAVWRCQTRVIGDVVHTSNINSGPRNPSRSVVMDEGRNMTLSRLFRERKSMGLQDTVLPAGKSGTSIGVIDGGEKMSGIRQSEKHFEHGRGSQARSQPRPGSRVFPEMVIPFLGQHLNSRSYLCWRISLFQLLLKILTNALGRLCQRSTCGSLSARATCLRVSSRQANKVYHG